MSIHVDREKKGLFMVERSMLTHPIVGIRNRERFCMWMWMLAAASWKMQEWSVSGEQIIIERGQLFFSIRKFAEKNRVSKSVAERFLRDLKAGHMIKTVNRTGGSLVTICNYDEYQDFENYNKTRDETLNETATRQQQDSDETAAGHKRNPLTPSSNAASSPDEGISIETPDLKLRDLLMVAIGEAANKSSAGLLATRRPEEWLEAGCDLKLDILPTIKNISDREFEAWEGGCISSWKYFERAVIEARNDRLTPKKEATHGKRTSKNSRSSKDRSTASRDERRAFFDEKRNEDDGDNDKLGK